MKLQPAAPSVQGTTAEMIALPARYSGCDADFPVPIGLKFRVADHLGVEDRNNLWREQFALNGPTEW